MQNNVLENLKLYFPSMIKGLEKIIEKTRGESIIKLKNGKSFLYDNVTKTLRLLPSNSGNMTEAECRKEFALRLYKILLHKGLTQKELSQLSGIVPSQLSLYITGKRTPSFYAVDKIAKALNCSMDEFRYLD